MQLVTDEDRALLTAPNLSVEAGAELLDDQDRVLTDLSRDLVAEGSSVERSNYASVHGTCSIELLRQLDWRTARVRLFQTITDTDTGTSKRYNLGVYVLTTPEQPLGEDPPAFSVEGYDKLHLLQHAVGDTYVVPAGTSYLDAARQAITDAGVAGLAPRFAGEAEGKLLDAPMVWVLDTQEPDSWLRVVNDLLAAVGYRGLWVDQDGRYRSEPYQSPAVRPPEWTHDLSDPRTCIVDEDRTYTEDGWDGTNWWRFIRDGMATQPVEGAGLYTVDRSNGGRQYRRHVQLTAADQASLVAQGDARVDTDTQRTRQLTISTGPLPVLGHMDVATYRDPALGELKVLTRSHSIPLDGDPVELELEVVA